MASKVSKIRIVHCPRCWQLLTEFADITLYKCGGCGLILQAKKRSGGLESSTCTTHETNLVQKYESENEDNELIASSNQTIICSTDACIPGKGQVESADCGKNMPECRRNSTQISTSEELSCHSKEAVVETGEESDCNEGRSSKLEIPVTNSQLTSMDMHSNAISSADEPNYRGKKVMKETGDYREESDSKQGSGSNPENLKLNGQLAFMGMNATTMPVKQSDMSIQMKIDKCSLDEQVEKCQKLGQCGSDHIKPQDEMEESKGRPNCSIMSEEDMIDTKLGSTTLEILSKSPTTKSSHAYYGSVSSYGDDWDDHAPNQHLHLLERTLLNHQKRVDSFNNKGKPMQESDSQVQSQARKFLPMSANEKYGSPMTGSIRWNQDEPSGLTGHGFQAQQQGNLEDPDVFHSVRSWVESERDVPYRLLSRDLRNRRELLPSLHQNGSSSSYEHEGFSHSPSSYASDKFESIEQDQMELLRKVEELRDKLQRSHGQKGKVKERFHGRVSQLESQRPSCSSYELGQEILWYYDAKYPWNPPGTYGPRKAMPHQYGPSRMPSSEQAKKCRHHVDYSCLHCYPQDWQYPAQLPPSFCCKKGPYRGQDSHNCYHPFSSSMAVIPQRHVDSSFHPHFHNSQPHEQMEKSQIKEKHRPVKRHCRPMAGGAPFVICYICWKLLQLPADFLLSKRRHHKLRCGACSKVLMFSLNDSRHKLSCNPAQAQHPPSEVGHSTDTATGDLASSSRVGDPVSYSDDYGPSICKSYSTEGEPALLASTFPVPQTIAHDGKNHASTSITPKPMKEKMKLVSKRSENKSGNSRHVFGSPIPSSDAAESEKSSLEVNAGTPIMGSPLHQLMGYSSPSELINGSNAVANYHAENLTNKVLLGSETCPPLHEISVPRTSRNYCLISEKDELAKRSRDTRDSSLPGFIKKGIRELDHGLENVKLKAPVNGIHP